MKKLRYSRRAGSQEQPRPLETSIFAEQQQHAKQGTITSPSGADQQIRTLASSSPVTDTLAGVTRDALAVADLNKIVILNTGPRTVTVVPAGTDIAPFLNGLFASGTDEVGTITMVDPSKATGPMQVANPIGGVGAMLVNMVGPAKPSLSVEGLLNRIEDALPNDAVLIVVDQSAQNVRVFVGGDVATTDAAAQLPEDAHFVQTLVSAGGRQFGE